MFGHTGLRIILTTYVLAASVAHDRRKGFFDDIWHVSHLLPSEGKSGGNSESKSGGNPAGRFFYAPGHAADIWKSGNAGNKPKTDANALPRLGRSATWSSRSARTRCVCRPDSAKTIGDTLVHEKHELAQKAAGLSKQSHAMWAVRQDPHKEEEAMYSALD